MAEEELAGVLTFWRASHVDTGIELAWDFVREALRYDYYLFVRFATPEPSEYDLLGTIDRELMAMLWRSLPPILDNQNRIYFVLLSDPLASTGGAALAKEIRSRDEIPVEASDPNRPKSEGRIGAFRLLRHMWERPEVVDGVFAAFTWELSWPHLEKRESTFEEMIDDLHHWFDRDGKWKDRIYYVGKVTTQ